MKKDFKIKENSVVARLGAWKLKTTRMALTIGHTIHLYNTSAEEFLRDPRWVKHELKHVDQYEKYGLFNFLLRYAWQSLRHGYHNNRFEKEAREAEKM